MFAWSICWPKRRPAPPIEPDPPAWSTPLNETATSIHYEGDTGSV